jgi:hypothetical protein
MADEPEDDEIVIDAEAEEPDEPIDDQGDDDAQDPPGQTTEANDEAEDGDVEYAFGDTVETARGDDSGLVKRLRETIKEKDKRLAELQRAVLPEPEIEVGAEPTWGEGEEWDWDGDKYDAAKAQWRERKQKADSCQQEQRQRAEEETKEAEQVVQSYRSQKEKLAKPDYDDAETAVFGKLGGVKASLLVQGADNAALVVHALSRFPDKLDELAAIKNPTKFAFAAAKLEGQLKAMPKRTAPKPEEIERGSARASSNTEKELDRLEKDAEKSGDRSKLIAYKSKMKG